MSPIPLNLNLGFDNGPSSPMFSRKNLNPNRFGNKSSKEENNIEYLFTMTPLNFLDMKKIMRNMKEFLLSKILLLRNHFKTLQNFTFQ